MGNDRHPPNKNNHKQDAVTNWEAVRTVKHTAVASAASKGRRLGRTMLQGIPTVARVRRLSGRIINVDCVERRGSTRCELPEGDSAYSEVCDTCGRRCGTSVRAGGGGRIRLIRKAVQRNWRNGGTVAGDLSGRSGAGRTSEPIWRSQSAPWACGGGGGVRLG